MFMPYSCIRTVASRGTKSSLLPLKLAIAHYASFSHDDFAPKRTQIDNDEEAIAMIKQHIADNRVMLYMKGNPSMPMCGFSAKVVGLLQAEGADFSSVNVLDYPAIREGIKKFSDWPTIPQLYIAGEFVGGCDVITSMHENGELSQLLSDPTSK